MNSCKMNVGLLFFILIFIGAIDAAGAEYSLKRTCYGSQVGKQVLWKVTPALPEKPKLILNNLNGTSPDLVVGSEELSVSEINGETIIGYTFKADSEGIYHVSIQMDNSIQGPPILQIIAPDASKYENIQDFIDTTALEEDIINKGMPSKDVKMIGANGKTIHVYDVIVVDGTSAGIGAAVTAAREGLNTCLLDSSNLLGGMFTNGIGKSDIGLNGFGDLDLRLSYGLMNELRLKIESIQKEKDNDKHYSNNGLRYRPSVVRRALYELIREAIEETGNLDVKVDSPYKSIADGAFRKFNVNGEYEADYIIDSTDCGDVAADKGADFDIGDPNDPNDPTQAYSFVMTVKDWESSNHWSYMAETPVTCGVEGEYTEESIKNSWTWSAGKLGPNAYQVKHHKPSRVFESNGKEYWKLGYELIDSAELRPDLGLEDIRFAEKKNDGERYSIMERYFNHALCFLHKMQQIQDGKGIGLTSHEDPLRVNFPARIYVREGRRIKGLATFTGEDALKNWSELDMNLECFTDKRTEFEKEFQECANGSKECPQTKYSRPTQTLDQMRQGIGVVTYSMDRHDKYQEKTCEVGDLKARGECSDLLEYIYSKDPEATERDICTYLDYLVNFTGPAVIPLGIMMPVKNDIAIENILVPLAVSSTERGYSTLRMDPTRINLGQAAALAIVVAREKDVSPHQLIENESYMFELQKRLIMDYGEKIYLYRDSELSPNYPNDYLGQQFDMIMQFLGVWQIAKGYSSNRNDEYYKFIPGNSISRAEFVKMALIASPLHPSEEGAEAYLPPETSPFPDIPTDHWAKGFINYAANNEIKKIVQGYGDGNFLPNNDISRAEVAKVVLEAFNFITEEEQQRLAKESLDAPPYEDLGHEKAWYRGYILKAAALGILKTNNENIRPNGSASRREVAEALFKALCIYKKFDCNN